MNRIYFFAARWMLLAVFFLLPLWSISVAKDRDFDRDRASLMERIKTLTEALRNNDMKTLIEAMPPRLVDAMAKTQKLSASELQAKMLGNV